MEMSVSSEMTFFNMKLQLEICPQLRTLPYFAEVKQGGMYIKFRCHCLSSAKMSQSAK